MERDCFGRSRAAEKMTDAPSFQAEARGRGRFASRAAEYAGTRPTLERAINVRTRLHVLIPIREACALPWHSGVLWPGSMIGGGRTRCSAKL